MQNLNIVELFEKNSTFLNLNCSHTTFEAELQAVLNILTELDFQDTVEMAAALRTLHARAKGYSEGDGGQ